ncbi:hypothetical protein B0H10DRAFT_1945375 [Mycena sp. CBHHK59/15]|nr:hypothetical protein B0H10DRAFT_1945375 [Mycena sp. CBHHK59/15]
MTRYFPDPYGFPVAATNYGSGSESSETLTHVQSLARDVGFLQGEVRSIRGMLELLLEATRNPNNEAPWIRIASEAYRIQPVVLPKSPLLAKLMQQYPDIWFWAPTDFDGDGDSVPRTKAKKSTGGTDKKNDVNNDGQYIERVDGTIVGGIEFGQMREYLNNLLFDLLTAKKATRSLAHIGEHVRGALIHMLEQRYPHIGLCAEHWKAHRLIQGRYRYWAGPFRDRLVTYNALEAPPGAPPPPPPAAPLVARKRVADDPLESEHAKRQQLLEDESLIQMSLPPGDTVPRPDTDRVNPEQARDTRIDPAVTGGTDGAPPVQPDMFTNIVVNVPPPPPTLTPDAAHPVPSLPPAASLRSSKNKVYTPNPNNLYSAVYCADVACSEAEYKLEWTRVQADDPDRVKLYEEYANELKNTNPKPTTIPEAAAILKRILELAVK